MSGLNEEARKWDMVMLVGAFFNKYSSGWLKIKDDTVGDLGF